MILLAALLAATGTQDATLAEAAHAVRAGRLAQARLMIGAALRDGAGEQAAEPVLADLAFAEGDLPRALALYRRLLAKDPANAFLAERAGTAALRLGDLDGAKPLLQRATRHAAASWQAWNALGVLADQQGDFAAADAAYRKAAAIQPPSAALLNNMGWSQCRRGNWAAGLDLLARAAALDPRSDQIARNLELARSAVAPDLPERRTGETPHAWAQRLNDAGVVARLRGDKARARAAFARAIEAHGEWYERAASNLGAIEGNR